MRGGARKLSGASARRRSSDSRGGPSRLRRLGMRDVELVENLRARTVAARTGALRCARGGKAEGQGDDVAPGCELFDGHTVGIGGKAARRHDTHLAHEEKALSRSAVVHRQALARRAAADTREVALATAQYRAEGTEA